jgi:hypothetical protein
MKAMLAPHRDRKRSQRGSVLSGVLIMVAFLAIISGALVSALSTNFLLSRALVNRVANEATVSSAVEVTLDRLQNTALTNGCPGVSPVSLNGRTAVAAYISCWPTVDSRSLPGFSQIASSTPFNVDGTHAAVNGDYVVGNSGGTVFDFPFGASSPRWTLPLGGAVTGTPLVMTDPSNGGQYLDLVPVSGPSCGSQTYCVQVEADAGSRSTPTANCTLAASGGVVAQPAAGIKNSNVLIFGDSTGQVFAYDIGGGAGGCDREGSPAAAGNPIVAGPVVLRCQSSCTRGKDDAYLVASSGSSSQLLHFTFDTNGPSLITSIALPWGNASGIAVEATNVPTRLAISFAGGGIGLVQVSASGGMTLSSVNTLPTAIGGAPYWCSCGATNVFGVGGQNGSLYLVDPSDPSLRPLATLLSGGPAITTTPAADAVGDWFFAADDGNVYEAQRIAGSPTMALVATFGGASAKIGSSVQVGGCGVKICIYLGALDGTAYLVPLDARDAVLSACISTSPPACSGDNPRLWTQVEVGSAGSLQTVHVQGWSYYSP